MRIKARRVKDDLKHETATTKRSRVGRQTAQGSSLFLLQVLPVLERLTGRLKGERSTPSSSVLRSSATFTER